MELKTFLVNDKITASCQINMSPKHYFDQLGFSKTAHLPLPQANINTYFSFRAKCGIGEGRVGSFPET